MDLNAKSMVMVIAWLGLSLTAAAAPEGEGSLPDGVVIDETASQHMPWPVNGVMVAEGYPGKENADCGTMERRFLGVTNEGLLLVQDFYTSSGQKASAPFLMSAPSNEGFAEYMEGRSAEFKAAPFVGMRRLFLCSGEVWMEGSWQDGLATGVWSQWSENGQLILQGTFRNGKKDGLWKSWYESGALLFEATYRDGLRDGLWRSWNPDGQLFEEGLYTVGERVGVWRYWNGDGSLREERHYP